MARTFPTTPDPILDALEAARDAQAALATVAARTRYDVDSEPFDRAVVQSDRTIAPALKTVPTTLAGLIAYVDYVRTLGDDLPAGMDHEVLETVATALNP